MDKNKDDKLSIDEFLKLSQLNLHPIFIDVSFFLETERENRILPSFVYSNVTKAI